MKKIYSFMSVLKVDYKNNSRKSFVILFFYRILHKLYYEKHNILIFVIVGFIKELVFWILNINAQISHKAHIGVDIRLPHSAMGVVISSKAIIADHQTIFHQVTIGINENKPLDKQRIIINENCYLSAGCKIISCEIGAGSKIGPNAVVYKDLPEKTIYVADNHIL